MWDDSWEDDVLQRQCDAIFLRKPLKPTPITTKRKFASHDKAISNEHPKLRRQFAVEQLPHQDQCEAHLQTCQQQCGKCTWARNKARWLKATQMGESGNLGSWLRARPCNTPDSKWGVYCKPCKYAAEQSKDKPFFWKFSRVRGKKLCYHSLNRHQQRKTHKDAVVFYFKKGGIIGGVPEKHEFMKLWERLTNKEQASVGGNKRTNSMLWCLFEAVRDRELAFLKLSACISVSADERHGRLLIKYAAASPTLDVRTGVLAQMRDSGMCAQEVAGAVHKAVARICTRRAIHKHLNKLLVTPRTHTDINKHIVDHIEMYAADGASSEQLAGKLLHPQSARGNAVTKLPNLRVVLRDKAHASRRITERTFQTDPALNNVLVTVVTGPKSLSRLLKNSRIIQNIFEKQIDQQTRVGNAEALKQDIRNMSFAKQRFDSTAKPLGRALLNLDAAISTMDIISQQRDLTSKEGQGAMEFLDFISNKNILLMGMMADATDEALMFVRFFDREAFSLAESAHQLKCFLDRLKWLFTEQGCRSCGYTQLAIDYLKHTKVLPLKQKTASTIYWRPQMPTRRTCGRMFGPHGCLVSLGPRGVQNRFL